MWPYPVAGVMNPGAAQLPQGQVALIVRVELSAGQSQLRAVNSLDGLSQWSISKVPTLMPKSVSSEAHAIEDPRITFLKDIGIFVVTYTIVTDSGPSVGASLTDDLKTFDHLGMVLPVDNKNAVIFPRKIHGLWFMLHRPVSEFASTRAGIWGCTSTDLRHWGNHREILAPRGGARWDSFRIGAGPPPLETGWGWVLFYQGVYRDVGTTLHRVGALLLAADNPFEVLSRPEDYLLAPDASYERVGGKSTVFCTGLIRDEKRSALRMYYGAADRSVCAAEASLPELYRYLMRG